MKITEVGAFEAKTHLSELLEKVSRGQSFRITRRGKAVAELRPVEVVPRKPKFGADKGLVTIADDFEAPIPEMEEYTR